MKTQEILAIWIKKVLDRLWVQYFHKSGSEYWIYENWNKTSWWSFNDAKNIISDFSHWDRASWDIFWFVKQYLKLDDSWTFKRFSENFGVWDKKSIWEIWHSLQDLTENQKEYLKSRLINPEKISWIVKNYNWWIWCLVYEWWIPKGLNARTLSKEKDSRFIALSWYSTKWIYQHKIDANKNYLIVVEWLIDFLTIRQYDTNVIWLKSAESWIEEVIEFSKKYSIYFVGDNDEAWIKTKDKLKGIQYKSFDLSWLWEWIKDINDVVVQTGIDDIVVDLIITKSVFEAPISTSFKKLSDFQKIIAKNWKLWFDWPFRELYNHTQGIIPWKVYTIGAYSNTGKSKFAYAHIKDLLLADKKVAFINLEVDEAMCLGNIVCATENRKRWEIIRSRPIDQNKYSKLIIRDDLWELDKICEFIKASKVDVCFIDFVQNIQAKWSSYEKNALIAQTIQKTAIETKTTIFSIAQINNSVAKEIVQNKSDLPTIKGAGEYVASSDVIIMLTEAWDNLIKATVTKNKFGKKWVSCYYEPMFSSNQFILADYEKPENDF